jgi:LmbE family N-acetylglucosaminyl deacetylase
MDAEKFRDLGPLPKLKLVPGGWHMDLEKDQDMATFESLFPQTDRFVFVQPHDDDCPIACGQLILSLIARHRECLLVTCLIDGNLGVFDDYAIEFAKEQGIPLSNPATLRQIKELIRYKESNAYADKIGIPHFHLGLDWEVTEPVYRAAPAGYTYLDAHSSTFALPSLIDRARVERLVEENQGAVFVLYDYHFLPGGSHPHHHCATALWLQGISRISPKSRLLFFCFEREKQALKENMVFFLNDTIAEKSFALVNEYFTSQNARHYNPTYYGDVARRLAESTCKRHKHDGTCTYRYAESFQFCELLM